MGKKSKKRAGRKKAPAPKTNGGAAAGARASRDESGFVASGGQDGGTARSAAQLLRKGRSAVELSKKIVEMQLLANAANVIDEMGIEVKTRGAAGVEDGAVRDASTPKANGDAAGAEARAVRDGSAVIASGGETGGTARSVAQLPRDPVADAMKAFAGGAAMGTTNASDVKDLLAVMLAEEEKELANQDPDDEKSKLLAELGSTADLMAKMGVELKRKGDAALEVKELRDELAELTSREEFASGDLDEETSNGVKLAQLLMAHATKMMAVYGVVEEQTHSSLDFCEEHGDELFGDGGAEFRQKSVDAFEKARSEVGLGAEWETSSQKEERNSISHLMRNLIHELRARSIDLMRAGWSGEHRQMMEEFEELAVKGDRWGQNRIAQRMYNDLRAREGLPPECMFPCSIIDDELFAPPPPRPDCPICFLTLPSSDSCTYQACCGKTLCEGCIFSHRDSSSDYLCPFCRAPLSGKSNADLVEWTEKRAAVDDRDACSMLGAHYLHGTMGLPRSYEKAFELLGRAADLGSNEAHHMLGMCYHEGTGMEKDEKKSMHHLRLAAIGGLLESRFELGNRAQWEEKNTRLALKHWYIAAQAGHDSSLEMIKRGHSFGIVTKEAYAVALRSHKAATDEVKSEQRARAAILRRDLDARSP